MRRSKRSIAAGAYPELTKENYERNNCKNYLSLQAWYTKFLFGESKKGAVKK